MPAYKIPFIACYCKTGTLVLQYKGIDILPFFRF